jgi:hypothetical protein
MASSLGRVRIKETQGLMPNGAKRQYKTKPTFGYEDTTATRRHGVGGRLHIVHRGKTHKIHVLVCEAFHGPKPFSGAIVIHEDENPQNNRADNLRWGTRRENQNYPKAIEAFKARTGENSCWAIHRRRNGKE